MLDDLYYVFTKHIICRSRSHFSKDNLSLRQENEIFSTRRNRRTHERFKEDIRLIRVNFHIRDEKGTAPCLPVPPSSRFSTFPYFSVTDSPLEPIFRLLVPPCGQISAYSGADTPPYYTSRLILCHPAPAGPTLRHSAPLRPTLRVPVPV